MFSFTILYTFINQQPLALILLLDPYDQKEVDQQEKQSTEGKKNDELKNAVGKLSKLEQLYKETCVEKSLINKIFSYQ